MAGGNGSAAIDTTNNMFLHVLSRNSFAFWDLDHPGGEWENRGIKVIPNVEGNTIPPNFGNFGVQFDPTLGAFMLWDGSSSVWLLTPPDDLDANNDGILDVATGWQLEEIEVSGDGPRIPAHGHTQAFSGSGSIWRSTTLSLESLTPSRVMCSCTNHSLRQYRSQAQQ